MNILLISGSTRQNSTNTQLLRNLALVAPTHLKISLFENLQSLPIFSPDLEGAQTPHTIYNFCQQIADADGIIISSPEYVRAIPGGLKNAIDWLVQREQIIHMPVALLHASHRGEDMLASLRLVISTVTENFQFDNFASFDLMAKSPIQIKSILQSSKNKTTLLNFVTKFEKYITEHQHQSPSI